MSSLYLAVAVVGSCLAVLLLGVVAQLSLSGRRRPAQMLESQLTRGASSMDLREDALARTFAERVTEPATGALARLARRLTPVEARDRLAHKLVLAGSPVGWSAESELSFKGIGLMAGAAFGAAVAWAVGLPFVFLVLATAMLAIIGFLIPGAILGQRVVNRQDEIRRTLPDTTDLLIISVEAGLGFDAALMQVTKNIPGPLAEEIGRMLHEMRLGVSRADAFRQLADRTDVDELRSFVLGLIQADILGVSVSKVLRAQAHELRVKRRQRAEHQAMQMGVKLLFPLIFCVLPSLFVVMLGPGIIKILDSFIFS
jgi:tight adherence protein C